MGFEDPKDWDEERLRRSEMETLPDLEEGALVEERVTLPDLAHTAQHFRQTMETMDMPSREREVFDKILEIDGVREGELMVSCQTDGEDGLDVFQLDVKGDSCSYVYIRKGSGSFGAYIPRPAVSAGGNKNPRSRVDLPDPSATVLLRLRVDGSTEEIYRWNDGS